MTDLIRPIKAIHACCTGAFGRCDADRPGLRRARLTPKSTRRVLGVLRPTIRTHKQQERIKNTRSLSPEETMKKTIFAIATLSASVALAAASAAPLPEAKPDDVGFSHQGLSRFDDFFSREIPAKRVPGAVIAVARDGKLVLYKAYGKLDPAKDTAMPLDPMFALASMTKPQTTVAGLTLMEQGRLPLQAKLSDYYPGFADMKVGVQQADGSQKLEPQASPIYIHDLYRHTSGLMYAGRPGSPTA